MTEKKDNMEWLNVMFWEFQAYMTASRWDNLTDEGVYEDDGLAAIGAFLEYIRTGAVTGSDMNELEA